ncbi:probable disease resistance protein At1g58602 [Papaver somniferum]|uniref:probable disease resistance protein At1g58602 n=1 Tax=Papaver somniferum TaxID=3469 RepID=UPI000E6F48D0|nr:probable disease resistance protein At1g58602 [Papaver somniferum]
MVDAVVSFAVEKLGDALIHETFFLLGVRDQVQELRDELRRMQCFLKDADAKQQQGDHRVRNWVADIRNVAYDAEDVVDTFVLKIGATHKSGGVLSLIKRKALMVKNLRHLHRVGEEIQAIRAKLKAISASTVTYGIKELPDDKPSSSIAPLRNYYAHVQDEDVTGLVEQTKTLLTELSKDEERVCVVSIVGVGGLGKTTLAKKIYQHDDVMRHFDCRAWCSISQQLNMRDVLKEIIKKFMNPSETELSTPSDGNLVEKLSDYLQDKQYFVVVDDLWSFQDWSMLSPAFPNGKRGSKILLTTRNKEVASQADPWSLQLEPELLNEEESWELLCKKAFPKATRDTNSYPANLEKLGREMVRKCGGLPLAICALGGILATKREDIKEWRYVHRDVASNINGGVMGILALSYNDLPVHLKPCFLYLSLFPEDYAIPRKKLIQLWIAEGFIQHTKEDAHGTLEEAVKRQYYGELIQRCMIQADKDTTPGEGKTCRMHDLMRDLCLSKGKELNFLDIYNNEAIDGTTLNSSSRRLRRYAINLNGLPRYGVDFHFNNSTSTLRTLLVQSTLYRVPSIKYQHMKLLRVLDLGGVDLQKNEIEVIFELIHLRYLEIESSYFHKWNLLSQNKFPSSIGNLRNLQTLKLDARMSIRTIDLPETIANLVELRHLEAAYTCKISGNFRIENLINLQTLVRVQAGKWIRKGCFGKLSKLQNLSVFKASLSQTDVLIHEISNNKTSSSSSSFDDQYQNPIRVLEISSEDNFDNKIFDSLSCCNNLQRLQLDGRLDGGLNLQKYPPNLTKLILMYSRLDKDPMETLQYLPNLKLLELLRHSFEGEEMVCSTKGFPQLQVLHIRSIDQLKKWTIDQGGMPCLKELELTNLKELTMLPEGLRFITTLKKLTMSRNMETIARRIVREVGEDWYKVQHIPSLTVVQYYF